MSKTLEIFTDGACSGNPGQAAIGVVIMHEGRVLKNISHSIGIGTNNIAEYTALIYGLQEALILHADRVTVYTDSELVCNQVNGIYKVKNQNLKFLHALVMHLASGFKDITVRLVPRERNREADALATQAVKREQAKVAAPLFCSGEESPSSIG